MVNDVISDALTRVRNAQTARHKSVRVPVSKVVNEILGVLKGEGFIESFGPCKECQRSLEVVLKYYGSGDPAISTAKRLSKPGRRLYSESKKLPKIFGGLGITIVSTSQGVMTDREARKRGIGGELVASVA